MANTIKNVSESHVQIFNPDALYVTPLTVDSEKNTTTRGNTTYKLSEVIRDTTTITQEDPTENKIENEFGSAPILNNVQLGSYSFSAEVADMQSTLLEVLCGYVKGSTKVDRTYAPSTYTPVYAEIALAFKTGTKTDGSPKYAAAVLPKVQLNSKATFDSLSSSMGRITLAGTGLNIAVGDTDANGTQIESPFYIDSDFVVSTDI